jgi:hypothetical protein
MQGGKLHRDLTHQFQFTGGEHASAKGEWFGHGE